MSRGNEGTNALPRQQRGGVVADAWRVRLVVETGWPGSTSLCETNPSSRAYKGMTNDGVAKEET